MPHLLEAGDARVTLEPESGGRIASLRVAGHELLVPRCPDPRQWGCYPMAPWAGRVRRGRFRFGGVEYALPIGAPPHAIHGTVLDRAWRDDGDGAFSIDLGPAWPWPGRALQRFALGPDGLDLRLEVCAEETPFPASIGWHPWFVRKLERGDPLELAFQAGAMYARDAEGIPDGERVAPPPGPWDDCFTDLAASPRLRWPGALDLVFTASCRHWVVYDRPAHALCLEPQTGPPDALNLAPRVVTPDDPLVLTARLSWAIEDPR